MPYTSSLNPRLLYSTPLKLIPFAPDSWRTTALRPPDRPRLLQLQRSPLGSLGVSGDNGLSRMVAWIEQQQTQLEQR
jgi:hypothetical protein